MKRVQIQFQDDNTAELFKDEMKKRFHFPENVSRYQVVYGKDNNGSLVFISNNEKQPVQKSHKIFSSLIIKSGFFSYCFDDYDGLCHEFGTLPEAKREAKKYTKEHPDGDEIALYGLSSFYYKNGKEV